MNANIQVAEAKQTSAASPAMRSGIMARPKDIMEPSAKMSEPPAASSCFRTMHWKPRPTTSKPMIKIMAAGNVSFDQR